MRALSDLFGVIMGSTKGDDRDRARLAQQLHSLQPRSTWYLDEVSRGLDRIVLRGWAMVDDSSSVALRVNDSVCPGGTFGTPRPDLGALFWYLPDSEKSGFLIEISSELAQGTAELEIDLVDLKTGSPLQPLHTLFYPLLEVPFPLPDSARRTRVHGGPDEPTFLINGYSTYRKIERALQQTSRRGWQSFASILDWGCGCGRVLRYLPQETMGRLTGVDIDRDNVEWCRNHFTGSRFDVVPLMPPTRLASDQFDLVFGISVFTHLKDEPQMQWLEELHRIVAPGGIVAVSTLGNAAVARAHLQYRDVKTFLDRGFLVAGLNTDLGSAIDDESYYVNTFHSRSYLNAVWGEFFDILGVFEGYIANHQDLVVMTPRKGKSS